MAISFYKPKKKSFSADPNYIAYGFVPSGMEIMLLGFFLPISCAADTNPDAVFFFWWKKGHIPKHPLKRTYDPFRVGYHLRISFL